MSINHKTIAIDWDGTIVDDGQFPVIGEPKPNSIKVMKRILEEGARIIIWTCRGGEEQIKGIRAKLNENGIFDFIINEHMEDILSKFEFSSPKVFADIYIDDRNLYSKVIDWYEVENILFPDLGLTDDSNNDIIAV